MGKAILERPIQKGSLITTEMNTEWELIEEELWEATRRMASRNVAPGRDPGPDLGRSNEGYGSLDFGASTWKAWGRESNHGRGGRHGWSCFARKADRRTPPRHTGRYVCWMRSASSWRESSPPVWNDTCQDGCWVGTTTCTASGRDVRRSTRSGAYELSRNTWFLGTAWRW